MVVFKPVPGDNPNKSENILFFDSGINANDNIVTYVAMIISNRSDNHLDVAQNSKNDPP